MAIKFICGCGKHLRAREDQASLRTLCPACGNWVGVPSLQSSQRGAAAGPMTPEERRRARRTAALTELPPETISPISPFAPEVAKQPNPAGPKLDVSIELIKPRKLRLSRLRRDTSESPGLDTVAYLIRRSPALFGLSLALMAFCGGSVLVLPHVREAAPQSTLVQLLMGIPFLALLVVPACVFGLLEHALAHASAGTHRMHWIGLPRAALNWSVCFLAGPVLFAGAAVYVWLNCGDPKLFDRAIISELAFVAVVYWLLAILSVHWHGSLRALDPARLVHLVRRLRRRALLIPWAALAALVLGYKVFLALGDLHGDQEQAAGGCLVLAGACFGGLLLAVLFFRLVGTWLSAMTPAD